MNVCLWSCVCEVTVVKSAEWSQVHNRIKSNTYLFVSVQEESINHSKSLLNSKLWFPAAEKPSMALK